jgi:predicted HTH domain antitoxin
VRTIEVPHELLNLLKGSRLAGRSENDQVRVALAIHLFQENLISIGKAAELADVPRTEFELLLVEMGIPVVRYDLEDYETDLRGIAAARRHETQ